MDRNDQDGDVLYGGDQPESGKKRRLKHGETVAGDAHFEKSVIDRIMEFNNKVGPPQRTEYLKPTKAALFGLQVRFANQKLTDHIYGKAKSKKKRESSMYHINNQLSQIKLTNRHSMPLDIQQILQGQKEYDIEQEKELLRAQKEASRERLGVLGKFRNNLGLEVDKLKSKGPAITSGERSP